MYGSRHEDCSSARERSSLGAAFGDLAPSIFLLRRVPKPLKNSVLFVIFVLFYRLFDFYGDLLA